MWSSWRTPLSNCGPTIGTAIQAALVSRTVPRPSEIRSDGWNASFGKSARVNSYYVKPQRDVLSSRIGKPHPHIESALHAPPGLRSERFAKPKGQYFHSVLVGHPQCPGATALTRTLVRN